MIARAALGLALVAALAGVARADAPCTGCILDAPAGARALLVVLHGDDAGPESVRDDWRAAARAAHVALFAPECPHALGCRGSWWRWLETARHDDAWLAEQIAAVEKQLGLTRVYLAGFSGGATYASAWAPSHASEFPAIALVSGGAAMRDTCPTAPQTALLEIGGDDDMLDDFVRPFASRFTRCADAKVTWKVIPHLGHHAMHKALAAERAREVIAWLLAAAPAPPSIVELPLAWSDARARATLAYRRAHSDPDAKDLEIAPRVIVLHYTDGGSAKATKAYFDQPELEPARTELRRGGTVNVSAHFLVDRDGTIYRLQPETRYARHCIGLNHIAIGIENVGDGEKWPLTDAQVAADAALVRDLASRYPITHLLAHSDVDQFRDHAYYVERDASYRNSKPDPGAAFMARVRAAVDDLKLAGPKPANPAKR